MTEEGVPIDDLIKIIKDLSGRRSMNSIAHLHENDVRDAVFEAGAGQGLMQLLGGVRHYEEHGEWPGGVPNEHFVAFVDAIDDAEPPGADDGGAHDAVGVQ